MGGCVVGLREGDVLAAGGLGGGVGEGVSGGAGGDGVGVGSQVFQSALVESQGMERFVGGLVGSYEVTGW